MKLSAGNLKNFDFKQLALDHGEKIGVAVIGLVLFGALFFTRWVPFERTPDELVEIVDQSSAQVDKNEWPEKEQAAFATDDNIMEDVHKMRETADVSRYGYRQSIIWQIYERKEPIREPKWLAVEDLMAKPGRFILSVSRGEEDAGEAPAALAGGQGNRPRLGQIGQIAEAPPTSAARDLAARDLEESAVRPEFQIRNEGQPGRDRGPASLREAAPQENRGGKPGKAQPAGRPGGGERPAGDYAREDETVDPASVGEPGRGVRFVAVRGVFPLKEQIGEVAKAMHENSSEAVREMIDIRSFELERQTAVAGLDPWAGPWEKVDIETAWDVLDEASNWDSDVVESGVLDDVISMPLPRRVFGIWTDVASHPRVENFELTEEEIDREYKLQVTLIEAYKKQMADRPEPLKEKQGFYRGQYNVRYAGQAVMKGSGREDFLKKLTEADPVTFREEVVKRIRLRLETPTDNILLFRYFDFDVEPGKAYRYRVRLVLWNPNQGRRPEEVADQSVALGPLRPTEWSDPTEPALVPSDGKYYLREVDQPGSAGEPLAMLNIFQWYADSGTVINEVLDTAFGGFIGGAAETLVLRPGGPTFQKEQVEFKSGDVLVDVLQSPAVNRNDHPDLNLPKLIRGRLDGMDRALVMKEHGDLVHLDQSSNQTDLQYAEDLLNQERGQFQKILEETKQEGRESRLKREAKRYEENDDGGRDRRRGGDRGGPNPLRKGKGKGK